jgi:hypothetical protein
MKLRQWVVARPPWGAGGLTLVGDHAGTMKRESNLVIVRSRHPDVHRGQDGENECLHDRHKRVQQNE